RDGIERKARKGGEAAKDADGDEEADLVLELRRGLGEHAHQQAHGRRAENVDDEDAERKAVGGATDGAAQCKARQRAERAADADEEIRVHERLVRGAQDIGKGEATIPAPVSSAAAT